MYIHASRENTRKKKEGKRDEKGVVVGK